MLPLPQLPTLIDVPFPSNPHGTPLTPQEIESIQWLTSVSDAVTWIVWTITYGWLATMVGVALWWLVSTIGTTWFSRG